MGYVDIRIKTKGIPREKLESIILNILEHVASERKYWDEEGIINLDTDDVEPVVLATPGNEALAKKLNAELREGYIFNGAN